MWHPSKNGTASPHDFKEFSTFRAWWFGDCGHEWESTIAHRSNGRGCPVCLGRVVVEGVNDLVTTHPEVASQWHPSKNGDLLPTMVVQGSGRMVWWFDHGHEWETSISSRTSGGQGCAVCRGLAVQIGVNDLATTHPKILVYWHPTKNSEISPTQITAGSHKELWWLGTCGHEWKSRVRTDRFLAGKGCPICRGLKVVEGINDLASQYPDLAAEWDPDKNGELSPTQVTVSTAKKIWWRCPEGHSWRTSVNAREYGAHGCPECSDNGYSPVSDGWLYLIRHDEWSLLQVGKTNHADQRLRQHGHRGWEAIDLRGPMDGQTCSELERAALTTLRNRGALLGDARGHEGFDGYTESWPAESLQLSTLGELISWIHDDEAAKS